MSNKTNSVSYYDSQFSSLLDSYQSNYTTLEKYTQEFTKFVDTFIISANNRNNFMKYGSYQTIIDGNAQKSSSSTSSSTSTDNKSSSKSSSSNKSTKKSTKKSSKKSTKSSKTSKTKTKASSKKSSKKSTKTSKKSTKKSSTKSSKKSSKKSTTKSSKKSTKTTSKTSKKGKSKTTLAKRDTGRQVLKMNMNNIQRSKPKKFTGFHTGLGKWYSSISGGAKLF